ncbi:hypothetical protein HAX54_050578, partial [Datura stramonium]|nr:hypothetical protein [Datura stramonium]
VEGMPQPEYLKENLSKLFTCAPSRKYRYKPAARMCNVGLDQCTKKKIYNNSPPALNMRIASCHMRPHVLAQAQ